MEKEILTVFLVKAEFQGFSSKSTSIHCLGAYGWRLWANKSLLTLQKADQKPVVWAHIADVGPCSTVGHKCWVLWRHLCALWPSASPMKPSRVKVSWDPDGHTDGAWPDGAMVGIHFHHSLLHRNTLYWRQKGLRIEEVRENELIFYFLHQRYNAMLLPFSVSNGLI